MKTMIVMLFCLGLLTFGCMQESTLTQKPAPEATQEQPKVIQGDEENVSINDSTKTEDNETLTQPEIETRERNGYVNLSEIGGENLHVLSAWDLDSPVEDDGTFTTTVSAVGSQMIFLMDENNETWATAISLPEDAGRLVFDVESTTIASLWVGGAVDQETAEREVQWVKGLPCYPELYDYLQNNLPTTSFAEIFKSDEYHSLINICAKEIHGQGTP